MKAKWRSSVYYLFYYAPFLYFIHAATKLMLFTYMNIGK